LKEEQTEHITEKAPQVDIIETVIPSCIPRCATITR